EEELDSDNPTIEDEAKNQKNLLAAESIEPINEDIALDNGLKPEDLPPPIDLDQPINTELTSQIDNLLSSDSVAGPATFPTPTPATPAPLPVSPPVTSKPNTEPTEDSSEEDSGLDF